MRSLIAGVAILLSVGASNAAAFSMTYLGRLTSFQIYTGGQWVQGGGADANISIQHFAELPHLLTGTCGSQTNYCEHGYYGGYSGGLYDMILTSPVAVLHPDRDLLCNGCGASSVYYSAYDPFRIDRGATEDSARIADYMNSSIDGVQRDAHIALEFSAPSWLPSGVLSFSDLQFAPESVSGQGEFEFIVSRGSEIFDGSYRGTFVITSAYVPTPGTLALLAMGGLVFGLRRHARSKVASH